MYSEAVQDLVLTLNLPGAEGGARGRCDGCRRKRGRGDRETTNAPKGPCGEPVAAETEQCDEPFGIRIQYQDDSSFLPSIVTMSPAKNDVTTS